MYLMLFGFEAMRLNVTQKIKKKKIAEVTLDPLFYLSGLRSPHLNNEVIGLEQVFAWREMLYIFGVSLAFVSISRRC